MEEQAKSSGKRAKGIFMRAINVIIIMMVLLSLGACTYTINLLHTEGVASDMVDETDNINPNIPITLPITVIPWFPPGDFYEA